MIFVHARAETGRTARALLEVARAAGEIGEWAPPDDHPKLGHAERDVAKSRNAEVRSLFGGGFGVHHAGMLRADRNLTERLFADGLVRCLVCTATLAWGVNLPAHTVIIKGTQVQLLTTLLVVPRMTRPYSDLLLCRCTTRSAARSSTSACSTCSRSSDALAGRSLTPPARE